jgi:hypothetical protein
MPFENPIIRGISPPVHAAMLAGLARPAFSASLPSRTVCRIVSQITAEMVSLLSDRVVVRRERRRPACHVRQISMYVCHVALQMSFSDIGAAFGRDRTTVGHACHVVEDRRDDAAFDEFVSAIERMATAVFQPSEFAHKVLRLSEARPEADQEGKPEANPEIGPEANPEANPEGKPEVGHD